MFFNVPRDGSWNEFQWKNIIYDDDTTTAAATIATTTTVTAAAAAGRPTGDPSPRCDGSR